MVKRTLICLLLACLVGGCIEPICKPGDTVNVWGLAAPEYDNAQDEFQGRIGLQRKTVEAGYETSYVGGRMENQTHGAYAVVYLTPTEMGSPYIGYHASLVLGDIEDSAYYGPIAGVLVNIGGIDSVVEYQYRDYTGSLADLQQNGSDSHRVFAGVRIKF